jgi:hypothetical protein
MDDDDDGGRIFWPAAFVRLAEIVAFAAVVIFAIHSCARR